MNERKFDCFRIPFRLLPLAYPPDAVAPDA
jgi:hypothetical protein